MALAAIEVVYVSIQVHAAIMEVLFIQDNARLIQIILNAAIIFLVDQMMEEMENVYFLTNAVELVSVENAQVEMISDVASVVVEEVEVVAKHIMVHAQVVVELA